MDRNTSFWLSQLCTAFFFGSIYLAVKTTPIFAIIAIFSAAAGGLLYGHAEGDPPM